MASPSSKLELSEDLFDAIKGKNFPRVKHLLEQGADPNVLLLNDVTPFHVAIGPDPISSYKYVELILEHNGNPNVCDTDGLTPLHVAANWGRADCLNLLLQHGADLHKCDKDGNDAMRHAGDDSNCLTILKEFMDSKTEDQDCEALLSPAARRHGDTRSPDRWSQARESQHVSSRRRKNKNAQFDDTVKISPTVSQQTYADYREKQRALHAGQNARTRACFDATSPDHCYDFMRCVGPAECRESPANETTLRMSFVTSEKGDVNASAVSPGQCASLSVVGVFEGQSTDSQADFDTSDAECGSFCETRNSETTARTSRHVGIRTHSLRGDDGASLGASFGSEGASGDDEQLVAANDTEPGCNFAASPLSSKPSGRRCRNRKRTATGRQDAGYIPMERRQAMLLATKAPVHHRHNDAVSRDVPEIAQSAMAQDSNSHARDLGVACVQRNADHALCRPSDRSSAPRFVPPVCRDKDDDSCSTVSEFSTLPLESSATGEDDSSAVDCYKSRTGWIPDRERQVVRSRLQSTCVDDESAIARSLEWSRIEGEEEVSIIHFSKDSTIEEHWLHPPESSSGSLASNEPLPVKLSVSLEGSSNDDTIVYDWKSLLKDEDIDDVCGRMYIPDGDGKKVDIPDHIARMSDDELRKQLIRHGQQPGPIAAAPLLYKRRLCLLEKGFAVGNAPGRQRFSTEFRSVLRGEPLPQQVVEDDEAVREEFADPARIWPGGNTTRCFNYLLLDPRVTKNLPNRAKNLSESGCLEIFAAAIFYIGKGTRTRPYAHFKEAITKKAKKSKKVAHIHDVWHSGFGVVSLSVFQNVNSAEAFTREAAMIDALGLEHLTNCVRGKCYGVAKDWDKTRLRCYGAFLLLSAMQILLIEGERQIRPNHLSK